MINQITGIQPVTLTETNNIAPSTSKINSFSDFLKEALNKVNDLQLQAIENDKKLVTGEIDDINKVMIDAVKADIALQLTIQIKNKVLEAYQEIMRMPL
ncbi:MAG: Flagellar hook-basal body complex protein FliE [Caldanaerobacter subterraneus]|jgi:flagellar hook-basal body complex protein FliE|uniref:Flagellar hook-basal body complex protein FliE n=1 Tax=Caldanaerobacter subterraneus TaxID=911092 RepID=A0A101E6I9_9THEO|nr:MULTISPECIES: flagellar hook-basal body complex protein FliE [Caldanaerobacter]KUK09882.1 MAG: Flagellar hook-basal body complex protein FliE [Caldanaerobacter subterraneus]MDI3518093.1 flagellar hook-basal body complex protein FliE [Caldanaerobacter sp.]HBT49425.1 flagellar hook-basal body complex protein FliE [Caldanaerobacter subterraneus]